MNQMNGQPYPDRKGFWKRYMEKYGIRKLPREITRPFLVTAGDSVDDKELRISPSWGMGMWLILLRRFGYLTALTGFLIGVATTFEEPFAHCPLIIGLAAGLGLQILSYLIKPRQVVFDRTTGMVRTPAHPLLGREATETPFSEWEAISTFHYNPIGVPIYRLFVRNTNIRYPVLMGVSGTFDEILAMWSFLLQYMKVGEPLPDVPDLEGYPNRTQWLCSWDEWEAWKSRPGFVDPYEVAKAKMESARSAACSEAVPESKRSEVSKAVDG